MKKRIFFLIATLLISVSIMAQQAKPWPVTPQAKATKNPVANNELSQKAGMSLYFKTCTPCHGKTGLGDGVKSRMLKTFPGNFSGTEYQKQTDGEHFNKIKIGRGEMPKYDGKIPDNDIWNMTNYMRTFKK